MTDNVRNEIGKLDVDAARAFAMDAYRQAHEARDELDAAKQRLRTLTEWDTTSVDLPTCEHSDNESSTCEPLERAYLVLKRSQRRAMALRDALRRMVEWGERLRACENLDAMGLNLLVDNSLDYSKGVLATFEAEASESGQCFASQAKPHMVITNTDETDDGPPLERRAEGD